MILRLTISPTLFAGSASIVGPRDYPESHRDFTFRARGTPLWIGGRRLPQATTSVSLIPRERSSTVRASATRAVPQFNSERSHDADFFCWRACTRGTVIEQ